MEAAADRSIYYLHASLFISVNSMINYVWADILGRSRIILKCILRKNGPGAGS
jgi:hypothetical protein